MFTPKFKPGQKVWLANGIGYSRIVLRYEGKMVVCHMQGGSIGNLMAKEEKGPESDYTDQPREEWC